MQLTNELGLPEPIAKAVANDPYSRGKSDITVTQLIDPPRKVELERRHMDEITEDVADRIWSLMGQSIHTILERAESTMLTERRLYTEVEGWTVGGAFDRAALISGEGFRAKLTDYKMASVYEVINGVKPERAQQLNLLAELARRNGYQIDGIEAIFILRDWSKTKAARERDFPQRQVYIAPLDLWAPEIASAFLTERMHLHQRARDAETLPECTDDERWKKPDVYAVMKEGRKSAVKLHADKPSADAHAEKAGKGHYVEHRPSEATRCKHYCTARPFCTQADEAGDC